MQQFDHDISRLDLRAVIGMKEFAVTSWKQVSTAYRNAITTMGLGASQTPPCIIVAPEGRVVAHVSYNGRVWGGDPSCWKPGCLPVYDPIN